MSDDSWYYSQNDTQQGPVAFNYLVELAGNGHLTSQDLVWQVGTPGWVEIRQVPNLFQAIGGDLSQAPPLPARPQPGLQQRYAPQIEQFHELRGRMGELDSGQDAVRALPHLRYVDNLFQSIKDQITIHQLDRADRLMRRLGSLSFMAATVLYAIYFSISSIRADSIQQLLAALLIILPTASVAHYLAIQLLDVSDELLRNSPTKISSENLSKSWGILLCVAAIALLVLGSRGLFLGGVPGRDVILGDINVDAVFQLVFGLCFLYAAATCFVHESLNLHLERTTDASREALGLGYLLAKIPLRSIPVTFGLFSLLAALSGVFFLFQLSGELSGQYYAFARAIAPWLLTIGLIPLMAYLTSIFGSLLAGHLEALFDTAQYTRQLSRGE